MLPSRSQAELRYWDRCAVPVALTFYSPSIVIAADIPTLGSSVTVILGLIPSGDICSSSLAPWLGSAVSTLLVFSRTHLLSGSRICMDGVGLQLIQIIRSRNWLQETRTARLPFHTEYK